MAYKKYTIDQIGEVVAGATPKTSDESNFGGNIAWITPADLSGYNKKYISHGARNLSQKGYDSCSARLMPKGAVLFTSRAPIGYVAIAENEICTNQGFKSIVPKNEIITSEFLYYQLIYLRNEIQSKGTGTTFKEISAQKMKEICVVVPPLDEQRRIVSRIEELFSQLDASVATMRKVKEQLRVYRQAVLKEAFDSAEKDCKMLPIAEILTKTRKGMSTGPFGTMIKKNDHKAFGVPMLGIENIGTGQFIDGNKIYVSAEKAEELKAFSLKAGDIIISRSGTVGEICAVPERAEGSLLSTNLMRISLDSSLIRSDYFISLFQSKGIVLDQIKELCKGSTREFLNQTILNKIVFPVPSIEKQSEIVMIIETRLSVCNRIEQTVDTVLHQAVAMRQSILKQAFDGGMR